MRTYTVTCVDTGNYECAGCPPRDSVRVFILFADNGAEASRWCTEFLIDEFGNDEGDHNDVSPADEWRIVSIFEGAHTPIHFGVPVEAIDKTLHTIHEHSERKDSNAD